MQETGRLAIGIPGTFRTSPRHGTPEGAPDGRRERRSDVLTLRVGLFGCGRIAGYFHAPILARMPGVTVTALADRDPSARKRFAAIVPGATLYADWRRPLELGEVDAAVICLPPAQHAPAAIAAFEAGAHVYVEKPLALSLEEADAMIAAQARSGCVGMTGLNFRHHPLVVDLRARLAAGEWGALKGVRSIFTSAARALPGWKGEKGQGGDAISDLGTHQFDLLPFVTGRDLDAATLACRDLPTPAGTLAAVLGTLDGVPLSMTLGQVTGQSSHAVELLCEKAHVLLDLAGPGRLAAGAPEGPAGRARAGIAALAPRAVLARGGDRSFEAALATFVDGCTGNGSPMPDLADGRRALSLALAASAAAEAARAPTGQEAAA